MHAPFFAMRHMVIKRKRFSLNIFVSHWDLILNVSAKSEERVVQFSNEMYMINAHGKGQLVLSLLHPFSQ